MALTSLQVVSVPVSDQDRAKQFYVGQLGFTGEVDSSFGDAMRWVMLRPPGSGTAITLVTWFESMAAGSIRGAVLGCDDLATTLAELSARGGAFNEEEEVQDAPWGRWKTFEDPDGNGLGPAAGQPGIPRLDAPRRLILAPPHRGPGTFAGDSARNLLTARWITVISLDNR